MSNKNKHSEIVVSKVIAAMFMFFILSVLAALYVMPFKKHYLQINDYYKIIEYISIGITFLLTCFSCINAVLAKKKSVSFDDKVVTPGMLLLASVSAFIGSVIIPLSNNRTVTYKYVILAFVILFVTYASNLLIGQHMSYVAIICGIYIELLLLIDFYYSGNATFNDKLVLTHRTVLILLIAISVLIAFISYLFLRKNKSYVSYYLIGLSAIIFLTSIIRFFVYKYVCIISVIVLILMYISFIFIERKKK